MLSRYRAYTQTARFARELARGRDAISRAIAIGPAAISCSWGKDSVALADLVLDVAPGTPIVHLAAPYALPGNEDVVEHFRARTTVHIVENARSLEEYLAAMREIGLYHERAGSMRHHGKRGKVARADAAFAALGIAVRFLGLRGDEASGRRWNYRARGHLYQLMRGDWICQPLAAWSAGEVWGYIAERGLPYNRRIYDSETHGLTRETIRNQGWLSTVGAGRGHLAWLRTHFAAEWRALESAFPRARVGA